MPTLFVCSRPAARRRVPGKTAPLRDFPRATVMMRAVDSFASGIAEGLAKYLCGPLRHEFLAPALAVGELHAQMCARCPRLELGEETCSFCDNVAHVAVHLRDDTNALTGPGRLCEVCQHALESHTAEAHGWSTTGRSRLMAG